MENYIPKGYNPTTGIYASSYIFQGDWENELQRLDYTARETEVKDDKIKQFDADKGIVTNYLYNAFRSEDGKSTTTEISDFWSEENPDSFSYTDSYFSSPKLAAICDWFQCEKTRIRIFQQQPGHKMDIHTDFDNQRGKIMERLYVFLYSFLICLEVLGFISKLKILKSTSTFKKVSF